MRRGAWVNFCDWDVGDVGDLGLSAVMDALAFGGKQIDGPQGVAALAEAVGVFTPSAPHSGENTDAGDDYVLWRLHSSYLCFCGSRVQEGNA